jgi:hypothetical protein
LREALARTDHDFILAEEPRRKPRAAAVRKAPAPAKAPSRFGVARVALGFLSRRPGRTIVGATATALVTGIILNAVMFQTGRHPAPLFGAPGMTVAAVKSAPALTPPLPAPRPAAVVQTAPVAAAPAMRAAEPSAAPRVAEPAPAPAKKDPIAALLNGEGVVEPSAPPARVAAVQKALIKTGFVLRADGVMGATTRQALERFEQDRKLPVTGELSPRTLRELAAQSGVAIP